MDSTCTSVLDSTIFALNKMKETIDSRFCDKIAHFSQCKGKLVFTGVGKSGFVAERTASTLASFGVESFFLNPLCAFHGDLGFLRKDDFVTIFSKSGDTAELVKLLPFFQERVDSLVVVTGYKNSSLAKRADVVIDLACTQEADKENILPTTTIVQMDTIANMIICHLAKQCLGYAKTFAQNHPG